jgi:uncharacterized membrane protein YkvA (DUF1232 family)
MVKQVSSEEAAARLKKDSEKIKEADVKKVLDRADDIEKKFGAKGPLGRFIKDVKLMLAMVKDYWDGNYREIPWWALASVVAALLYVLSPIDLIPDFIPVVGLMDDAAVVAACLLLVEQQLHEYGAWKTKQLA